MNHQMQHNEAPTWCAKCGTFDIYYEGECNGIDKRFDSDQPENFKRMLGDVFGHTEETK